MSPRLLFCIAFIFAANVLLAQSTKQDSISHHYDSLAKAKLHKAGSSNDPINNKIDAAQSKINKILNPNLNQIISKDKIEKKRKKKDSVEFYKNIEKQKMIVNNKIDSLERNHQPFDNYTKQLDSLGKLKYKDRKKQVSFNPQQLAKNKIEKEKRDNDSIRFIKRLNKEKKMIQSKIDSINSTGLSTQYYTHQLDSLNELKFVPDHNKSIAQIGDSLKSVNFLATAYSSKLDSLNKLNPDKYTQKIESKTADLQNKINQPASKIEGAVNEKLDIVKKEGGTGANLPSNAALPDAQLKGTSLPNTSINSGQLPNTTLNTGNPLSNIDNPLKDQLGKTGTVTEKINDVKGLPQEQMGKVKSIDELQSAQNKLGEANVITDKAQEYSKELKNITKGDLSETKELSGAAEKKAGEMGMDQFKQETGQFDQYKQMAEKAKDPKALKEEALKQAPKIAVNHFAGKEAVLQQAMEKMETLKSKYSEINSIKDLPKRNPNAMKSKRLIERLTPGITIQLQQKGDVLVDYNPYVGYRFYERFTAGLGWNERFSMGKHVKFSLDERIYGPRVFADFKIGRGFSVRTDIEKMNTNVPALTSAGYTTDKEYRAWMWSAFIGLKKEYKFSKRIKGNAQFLYNLYDDHDNSPYAERLAVRMGFELTMRKKKTKAP